jgi:hypothetical protein
MFERNMITFLIRGYYFVTTDYVRQNNKKESRSPVNSRVRLATLAAPKGGETERVCFPPARAESAPATEVAKTHERQDGRRHRASIV